MFTSGNGFMAGAGISGRSFQSVREGSFFSKPPAEPPAKNRNSFRNGVETDSVDGPEPVFVRGPALNTFENFGRLILKGNRNSSQVSTALQCFQQHGFGFPHFTRWSLGDIFCRNLCRKKSDNTFVKYCRSKSLYRSRRIVSFLGAILLCLTLVGSVTAAGYEPYPPRPVAKEKNFGLKKASDSSNTSFYRKGTALLDETTSFVKDVLGQFGLVQSKKRVEPGK